MDIWLAFIVGAVIGLFAGYLKGKSNICGNLRINRSDEEPYLFLELRASPDSSLIIGH